VSLGIQAKYAVLVDTSMDTTQLDTKSNTAFCCATPIYVDKVMQQNHLQPLQRKA